MFHGIKPIEVALSVDRLTMMAEIPEDFVTGALNRTHNKSDPTDKLRDEVYAHIGMEDDCRFLLLALLGLPCSTQPHPCLSR